MDNGKLHIYFGDGKGKTSAAAGLCARAAGSGLRVLFTQFFKRAKTGEVATLGGIDGISVLRLKEGGGFTHVMDEAEKKRTRAQHDLLLQSAIGKAGQADLLVLDEVLDAYELDLLDRRALDDFLDNRPPSLELALTGRRPTQKMLDLADYATEMKKIKHPFDGGLCARKGIEY